ncbi:hypothetical protein PPL_07438 [Heterostelium album PN500]|uniref:Pesticidal crystal protein N-terminal domain-containing protein n=1 Tax=Heterostelium pallidum (strain ATCC 26659 / Pp 5 / PN500) TaxID=670386 RepID=D3BFY7_HETP5|nr:hypothetical protein PPL_07438 [Heterostelium album PN500]EFA79747.1 hypothetical protein PPL_07438 [Heterostelium album PN500]|eukprot:XP_020431868.1 hypothetical protein PPL_07438 [Heterostelium album PN500]
METIANDPIELENIKSDFDITNDDKTGSTRSKSKLTKGFLDVMDRLLNYDGTEISNLISGTGSYRDTANMVASLVASVAVLVPVYGPILSNVIDLSFSIELIKVAGKVWDGNNAAAELNEAIAREQVMKFFQSLTTGKLDDVRYALQQLELRIVDVLKNNTNAQNQSSLAAQYITFNTQMNSMFNSVINQPMDFRMKSIQLFRDATQLYLIRVLSLMAMKNTLAMTPEFYNRLVGHFKIGGQQLYLRNVHVECQQKLNNILESKNIKAYFDYRNAALKNFDGIYSLLFSDPVLFPKGIYVDNPYYLYQVLYDDKNFDDSLFRSGWESLMSILQATDNMSYFGNLSGLICGFNDSNQIVMYKNLSPKRTTDYFPLGSEYGSTHEKTMTLDANAAYGSAFIGFMDYITVGKTTIGTEDPKMAFVAQKYVIPSEPGNPYKIGQIAGVRAGARQGSMVLPMIGLVDRGATLQNVILSSCATLIAPVKYTAKNELVSSNFDDVFIGFNSLNVKSGGEVTYTLFPANIKVMKYDVFIRVTVGVHVGGLLGTPANHNHDACINNAKRRMLDNSVPDMPLK